MSGFKKFLCILIFNFILFPLDVLGIDNNIIEKLNSYDVKFYKLDLNVDNLSEHIEGSVTSFSAKIAFKSVQIQLVPMKDWKN